MRSYKLIMYFQPMNLTLHLGVYVNSYQRKFMNDSFNKVFEFATGNHAALPSVLR